MKGSFCNIHHFTPSQKTIEMLKEMERITRSANFLSHLLTAVPIFQIFSGRGNYTGLSTLSSSYNITTYDWTNLTQAFSSINVIKRRQLETLAMRAADETSSKDRQFWKCVYNAL